MKVTLQNGHAVCASFNQHGDVESVAMSLDVFNLIGFIIVSFLGDNCAQEICASTSGGFVSVRNFQNNLLVNEIFRDVLHQKTFYYTYDESGRIIKTQMDSQNKDWEGNVCQPRDTLTHAPVRLYEELGPMPQVLTRDQTMPKLLARMYDGREKGAA